MLQKGNHPHVYSTRRSQRRDHYRRRHTRNPNAQSQMILPVILSGIAVLCAYALYAYVIAESRSPYN